MCGPSIHLTYFCEVSEVRGHGFSVRNNLFSLSKNSILTLLLTKIHLLFLSFFIFILNFYKLTHKHKMDARAVNSLITDHICISAGPSLSWGCNNQIVFNHLGVGHVEVDNKNVEVLLALTWNYNDAILPQAFCLRSESYLAPEDRFTVIFMFEFCRRI